MSEEKEIGLANQAKVEDIIEPTAATLTSVPTVPAALSPELAELIGEGKKYATPEIALASLPAKEAHITNIEGQLKSQEAIKELLEEAKANRTKGTPAEQVGTSQTDIPEMVRHELAVDRANQARQSNIIKVNDAFVASYGDKSDEAFNKLAAENGMSTEAFLNLTRESPDIVLKIAGLSKSTTPVGGLKTTVNTTALAANTTPEEGSGLVKDPAKAEDLMEGWNNSGIKAKKKLVEAGLIPPQT